MTIVKQPCALCPTLIVVRPNAKYCDECKAKLRKVSELKNRALQERKRQEQKSARLEKVGEEREFKRANDADTLHWMRYVMHQVTDIGESGPVIHYLPGTPEFEKIASLYK